MGKIFNIEDKKMIETKPKVMDDGIYIPTSQYVEEGSQPYYINIITKEVFIEAYNKFIKEGE